MIKDSVIIMCFYPKLIKQRFWDLDIEYSVDTKTEFKISHNNLNLLRLIYSEDIHQIIGKTNDMEYYYWKIYE